MESNTAAQDAPTPAAPPPLPPLPPAPPPAPHAHPLPLPQSPQPEPQPPRTPRARALPPRMLRDVLGIAVPTGAFGLSFGALAATSGFTTAQTCALSLLMFTGGSQFALVTSIAAGGAAPAATAVAILLGGRNALYSLRISALLPAAPPLRRALAAHLVIDESAAMAAAQKRPSSSNGTESPVKPLSGSSLAGLPVPKLSVR